MEIPTELIANLQGEPKRVIVNAEYFDKIVDELDLARNHKAYILVPAEDCYHVNITPLNIASGATPSSNLVIAPVEKFMSSWDGRGNYTLKHKNLATVIKKAPTQYKHHSQSVEEYESGSPYEEGEECDNAVIADSTAYSQAIPRFKTIFSDIDLRHLKARDVSKMFDPSGFTDGNLRPFMYRTSAVFIKGFERYILVLDSILDKYMGEVKKSMYREVPSIPQEGREYEDIPARYARAYDKLYGKDSFYNFIEKLSNDFETLKSFSKSIIREGKELVPTDNIELLERLEVIYSTVENPTSEDLSFEPKKYKFLIGFYKEAPILVKYQELQTTIDLLNLVGTDKEVYRMFSHNIFDPQAFKKHAYACPKDAPGQVKLYVKNFYEHLGNKNLPFKTIKRVLEWEKEPSEEDIRKVKGLYQGDPIQAVIDYYKLTGKGVSYWYVR